VNVDITKLGSAKQGKIAPSEVGVFLNESPNSGLQSTKHVLSGSSTSYRWVISKLKSGQSYYLTPYVISDGELFVGEEKAQTTASMTVKFSTKSASVGDRITLDGMFIAEGGASTEVYFGEVKVESPTVLKEGFGQIFIDIPKGVEGKKVKITVKTPDFSGISSEELELFKGVWTKRANFPRMSVSSGGFSFAMGGLGYAGIGEFSDDVSGYTPSTDSWTDLTTYPGSIFNQRYYVVGFVIANQVVTLNNAREVWHFTPPNTWTRKTDFPSVLGRPVFGFAIGADGYVGWSPGDFGGAVTTCWKYNITNDTWTALTDFPGTTRVEAVSLATSTRAYLIGGELAISPRSTVKEMWEFIPASGWSLLSNTPLPEVKNALGFVINDKIYFAGGQNGDGAAVYKNVREYDPTTKVWTNMTNRPGEIAGYNFYFTIDNKGYAGKRNFGFYQFDPGN
jgi:Kelch motif